MPERGSPQLARLPFIPLPYHVGRLALTGRLRSRPGSLHHHIASGEKVRPHPGHRPLNDRRSSGPPSSYIGRRTSVGADGYLLPNPEQDENVSIRRVARDRQMARCPARLSAHPQTVFQPVFTNAITRSRYAKISHIDSTPYAPEGAGFSLLHNGLARKGRGVRRSTFKVERERRRFPPFSGTTTDYGPGG